MQAGLKGLQFSRADRAKVSGLKPSWARAKYKYSSNRYTVLLASHIALQHEAEVQVCDVSVVTLVKRQESRKFLPHHTSRSRTNLAFSWMKAKRSSGLRPMRL